MVTDDDFDNFGVDLEEVEQVNDAAFEDSGIDLEQEAPQQEKKKEAGWLETIGDIGTQATRGALKLFTWPLDVLKIGMIGEGLSDIDELESAFEKAGKPFNREKYINAVLKQSQFLPTQELAEQGLESLLGISLEPKTQSGKVAKQIAGVAAFTPGGLAAKASKGLIRGGIAAGTTGALESAGVSEGAAEVLGDIAGMSPSVKGLVPRKLGKEATELAKTAHTHSLPFIEAMAREKLPLVRGRIRARTAEKLKQELGTSTEKALENIVRQEIPIKKLQERGVNLDALGSYAYDQTLKMAKAHPAPINTSPIVNAFDKEINRIKSLAPSPSDAQRAAINLLERERDIMKVAKPTSEQLIQQHMNYNADMKTLYRKPEFSGREEQVRKTYEFMKHELVDAMEKQGNKSTANAFRAANKIYAEKSKLYQTESLLKKAFDSGKYNPKKLQKFLNSKQGNLLKRNMGTKAIREVEEIAKYGQKAEEKMAKFIQINNEDVKNTLTSLGKLAPFLLVPQTLKGVGMSLVKPTTQYIQGKILTSPAAREVYKVTLKHASEGAFNLLKKDMLELENIIDREYGSVDDFLDLAWEDLEQD